MIDTPIDDRPADPCKDCGRAWCCRMVPVGTHDPDTKTDFEPLLEFLRWKETEVILRDDGRWVLTYRSVCRHLDPGTNLCGIHDSAAYPDVCSRYDAFTCWYREVFGVPDGDCARTLRFNRERLERYLENCIFDPRGVIHRAPGWNRVPSLWEDLPLDPAAFDGTGDRVIRVAPGKPKTASALGIVRFRENFPGLTFVESGDSAWFEARVTERFPAAGSGGIDGNSTA